MTRNVYRHADLQRVLDPASIAIVGASARPGAFGQRVLGNLSNFKGAVYPISRSSQTINGTACYSGLSALPAVPDCVNIAVPREQVHGVVQECAEMGVGGVIVYASGYAEVGMDDRADSQQAMVDVARAHDMRVVGPNCVGLINNVTNAAMTFAVPVPEPPTHDAPRIGLVSQSGALGFGLGQAALHGTAFSHVLSCGNSADVDVADCVAFLADDSSCDAIACAFEGLADPTRVLEAAAIAKAAGKPLVVCKLAVSEQGASAAQSHTGSLAGAREVYDAAFRQAGIVQVQRFEELIETATFFAKMRRSKVSGAAVVSTSGGAAIMAADAAELYGVPLPQPLPETVEVLAARIPEFGSTRNPCDITAQVVNDPESFSACAGALLADPAFGTLVVPSVIAYQPFADRVPILDKLAAEHGKAVAVVWLTQSLEGTGTSECEAASNVGLFRSMDSCFRTLAAWNWWSEEISRADEPMSTDVAPAVRDEIASQLQKHHGNIVSEREAKQALAAYGVPMVQDLLVEDEDACVRAAEACGYPVVLKVESDSIPHKTEAGVVRLALKDEAAVRRGYAEVMANGLAVAPASETRGVLVQPMVGAGVEVMIGARIDPLFGPVVLVGLGGVLVEVLKDSSVHLAPLSERQALEMLEQLKGVRLLQGFRGGPSVDLTALARIICRVGQFVSDHRDVIEELDVNPLICDENSIVGVDALIVLRQQGE